MADLSRYTERAYAQALANAKLDANSRGDGGGWDDNAQRMFDGRWAGMTDSQRLASAGGNPDRSQAIGDFYLDDDDPLVAQFREQFGDAPQNGVELQNQALTGYVTGVGQPNYAGRDVMADPSRIVWLDGEDVPLEQRRWVAEANNVDPQTIVRVQGEEDDSGLGDNFAAIALSIIGGAALAGSAGAFGAEAAGGAGAGEAAATGVGAVEAGSMAMPELVAAANPALAAAPEITAAGAIGGAAGGAAGASSAASPGIVSSVSVPADLSAGTAAAANPSLSAAPAINGSRSWFSTLTPQSQSLVARAGLQAAGIGASAVMSGIGQRNAQEFAAEQSDRARADRLAEEARDRAERDSLRTVAPRNIRITPRAGIIASNMRGG